MNLITDPWIPVRRLSGRDIVCPHQIAEADVLFPDWPRADLNLACLELLIGLVYLACPPASTDDWKNRRPDAKALQKALEPLAPAFNLLGEGPLFLQDHDENMEGSGNAPEMLFIDSSGKITAKQNKDVMVKRNRYPFLDAPLAAMALYTLQAFAPSGGAGNRTSMRGGGPMVTLVKPQNEQGLWPLVWANVPEGEALAANELEELPWMRPTKVSKDKPPEPPEDGEYLHPEVFFGQPRRLRLATQNDKVVGVMQCPYGTNYEGWTHPLTPYYFDKNKVPLPRHPKPGGFGYHNWLGVVLQNESGSRAQCLERFIRERDGETCRLIVGGWAMDNMSPLDFLWAEAPVFPLDPASEELAGRLVNAAEHAAFALSVAVQKSLKETQRDTGGAGRAKEMFYLQTQAPFEALLQSMAGGSSKNIAEEWLAVLRKAALGLFDTQAMHGMADLPATRRQNIVTERQSLLFTFGGYGKMGGKLFKALNLSPPKKKRGTKQEAMSQ